jgi:CRISPR-associated endonuclease/helicase Cas3
MPKSSSAFHEADVKQLCRQIAELAARYESVKAKVLIYVRSPEDVQKVEQELRKRFDQPVALLTGTLRGYERDLLVRENAVYRALLDHSSRIKESVYLVSTSAGEVGIDLDADHMVCDLTTLDSMIQRLGRVNRRGGRSARVDVVIATSAESKQDVSPHTEALAATRTLLARLQENSDGSYDVSPQAVGALLREISEKEKLQAFQPHPPAVLPTDILLDAWALTSIRKSLPGRPEVAPYLHGLTDEEPETFVAWRHEVSLLDQPNLSREALRQWFRACKIKSHELLRDRTDRVLKELKKIIARRHGEHIPVVVLTERGDAECFSLADLVRKVQSEENTLAFRTVVLPLEAGGLTDKGFLDGAWKEPASDVAEREPENARQPSSRRRIRLQIIEGEFWQLPFGEAETSTEEETIRRGECTSPYNAAMRLAREHRMVVSRIIPIKEPAEDAMDEPADYLVLLIERGRPETDDPEGIGRERPPTIEEHAAQVVDHVTQLANALGLGDNLKEALVVAANWHDSGKSRKVWQRSIYNSSPTLFAKPGIQGMDAHLLGGYRHEFGSILDASASEEINKHPERDLILHLIAAHHGHGRPHFEPEALNFEKHTTKENEDAAHEAMRRFARLQLRFGRWGLAWLESLLRCADAAASRNPLASDVNSTGENKSS